MADAGGSRQVTGSSLLLSVNLFADLNDQRRDETDAVVCHLRKALAFLTPTAFVLSALLPYGTCISPWAAAARRDESSVTVMSPSRNHDSDGTLTGSMYIQ